MTLYQANEPLEPEVIHEQVHKVIYVRCYFKKLSSFEKIGKIYNALRARHYYSDYYFEKPNGRPMRGGKMIRWRYCPRSRNVKQNRATLGKVPGCQYCFSFQEPRMIATIKRKGGMRFCVRVSLTVADKYKRQWKRTRNGLKQMMDSRVHTIAKGCFKLKAR